MQNVVTNKLMMAILRKKVISNYYKYNIDLVYTWNYNLLDNKLLTKEGNVRMCHALLFFQCSSNSLFSIALDHSRFMFMLFINSFLFSFILIIKMY